MRPHKIDHINHSTVIDMEDRMRYLLLYNSIEKVVNTFNINLQPECIQNMCCACAIHVSY